MNTILWLATKRAILFARLIRAFGYSRGFVLPSSFSGPGNRNQPLLSGQKVEDEKVRFSIKSSIVRYVTLDALFIFVAEVPWYNVTLLLWDSINSNLEILSFSGIFLQYVSPINFSIYLHTSTMCATFWESYQAVLCWLYHKIHLSKRIMTKRPITFKISDWSDLTRLYKAGLSCVIFLPFYTLSHEC